jgi:hypothetical protein
VEETEEIAPPPSLIGGRDATEQASFQTKVPKLSLSGSAWV